MARTFRHLLLVASTALAGASLPAHSHQDSDHVHLESTTLAEGLVHPWGMAFLPNGDLVVTERAGGIRVLKKDGTLTPRLSNVPEVAAVNQGGMLDITLDPDFEDNNTLYFMVGLLTHGHEQVVKTCRDSLKLAQDADDESSAALIGDRMRVHEKTAWMLRAMLPR